MKKIILFLFTSFILLTGGSQDTTKTINIDSITAKTDSLLKKQQDEAFENSLKQNERNLDSFMREMKERDRKVRQQMYLRLGLGIFFLIVLIIGLLRRRKKRTV